jgi:hypothetical protein
MMVMDSGVEVVEGRKIGEMLEENAMRNKNHVSYISDGPGDPHLLDATLPSSWAPRLHRPKGAHAS